jgi:integrase
MHVLNIKGSAVTRILSASGSITTVLHGENSIVKQIASTKGNTVNVIPEGVTSMSIFKRGRVYWYHFVFDGRHIQESTRQGNPRVARQIEAAHRTSLAKGEVGIREKKPVPTLKDFILNRFEPWAKAQFESTSPKTWKGWYRTNLRVLAGFPPLADKNLGLITGEDAASFAAHRQSKKMQVSSINSSLRVLRRLLRLAVEWGVIPSAPKIKLLRGERHRERVITSTEEAKFLAAAPQPLSSIATVLVDSGMRPEECFRLRWESVTWANGRHGTVLVTHGKTAAARRMLPMTTRVRNILEMLWESVGKPTEGWIWAAPTATGHVEPSTLKKQHVRTFERLAEQAAKNEEKQVRPFVLYTLRHTFLTRLGASGCNVWTLARIAGHSSIAMSARYVHPSEDAVLSAMTQMQLNEKAEPQPQRPALPS